MAIQEFDFGDREKITADKIQSQSNSGA